jgi:LPXTG-motif cell wall-anchored protein
MVPRRVAAAGTGSIEEAIVRNPVRKFLGLIVIGVLGALFAMPMLVAGAQTNGSTGSNGVPPDPPGDCVVLDVTPNPIPALGTQVTITGTAPSTDNTHVVLFNNGVPAVGTGTDVVEQDVTDGTFTLTYTVNAVPASLSVNFTFGNQNAYTAICADVNGITEFPITVEAGNVVKPTTPAAAQAQALAFTGSSDTPSYVLIGIAAIVLGAVLVVAARRRSQVS